MILLRVAVDALKAIAGGICRIDMNDNIGEVRKMMQNFMPGHLRHLMTFADQ